ncbi:MAG: aminotransferase class I/II-fold pyridoxal phosphate-dependent enzyme [Chitinophagaceae bacterium]|nr:aminotransferase class I/II-fold pyridoxal phosphate-dependent enzyme [Chitinophagaceae bacterium]
MLLLSGPNMGGNELKYVTECIETGWVSSVGSYVDKMEKMSAEFAGTKYAVATSCGTTALHICLILMGVNKDDLIITQNITFIATINSIKYTGANPVLIDTDESNWQMDLNLLEGF